MTRTFLFVLVFSLAACPALAESHAATQVVSLVIEEVAAIDAGADVDLTLWRAAPGAPAVHPTSSSAHLRYTSIVGHETNTIQAAISAGSVPRGTSLRLYAGGFGTNEGASAGELVLDTHPSELVSAISSCATGNGTSDGPTLFYTWSIDDPETLEADLERTLTVSFWLGDSRDDHAIVLRVAQADGS